MRGNIFSDITAKIIRGKRNPTDLQSCGRKYGAEPAPIAYLVEISDYLSHGSGALLKNCESVSLNVRWAVPPYQTESHV